MGWNANYVYQDLCASVFCTSLHLFQFWGPKCCWISTKISQIVPRHTWICLSPFVPQNRKRQDEIKNCASAQIATDIICIPTHILGPGWPFWMLQKATTKLICTSWTLNNLWIFCGFLKTFRVSELKKIPPGIICILALCKPRDGDHT